MLINSLFPQFSNNYSNQAWEGIFSGTTHNLVSCSSQLFNPVYKEVGNPTARVTLAIG